MPPPVCRDSTNQSITSIRLVSFPLSLRSLFNPDIRARLDWKSLQRKRSLMYCICSPHPGFVLSTAYTISLIEIEMGGSELSRAR